MSAARQAEIEVSVRVAGRDEQLQLSVFFQLHRSIDLFAFSQRIGRAVQTAAWTELLNGAGSPPLISPLRRLGGPAQNEGGDQ